MSFPHLFFLVLAATCYSLTASAQNSTRNCTDLIEASKQLWSGHIVFEGCNVSDIGSVTISKEGSQPLTVVFSNVNISRGSIVFSSVNQTFSYLRVEVVDSHFAEMTGNTFVVHMQGDNRNTSLFMRNSTLDVLTGSALAGLNPIELQDFTVEIVDSVVNVVSHSTSRAILAGVLFSGTGPSTITMRSTTITVVNSSLRMIGGSEVGCAGVLVWRSGSLEVELFTVSITLRESHIYCEGNGAVGAASIMSISGASGVIVGTRRISWRLERTNMTVIGRRAPVAAAGVVVWTRQSLSTSQNNVRDASIFSCDSHLTSSGAVFSLQAFRGSRLHSRTADATSLAVEVFHTVVSALDDEDGVCFEHFVALSTSRDSVMRNSTLACDTLPTTNVTTNAQGVAPLYLSHISDGAGHDITQAIFPNAHKSANLGPHQNITEVCPIFPPPPPPPPTVTTSRSLETASLTITRSASASDRTATASRSGTNSSIPTSTPPLTHTRSLGTPTRSRNATLTVRLDPSVRPRVGVSVILAEGAAEAVQISASSTAVVGGVLNPTAASQVARVGGMVRALECAIIQDDPRPSYVEMPLQVDLGDGKYATFAGSLLLTTVVLVGFPFAFHAAWWRWQPERTVVLKVAAAIHAVSFQYFVPNSMAGVAVLLSAGETTVELTVAVASLLSVFLLLMVAARRLVFDSQFGAAALSTALPSPHGSSLNEVPESSPTAPSSVSSSDKPTKMLLLQSRTTGKIIYVNKDPRARYVEAMFPFFDGCRAVDSKVIRLSSIEEVIVSSLIAAVGSLRGGNCGGIAVAVLVLVIMHFAFLLRVRPYWSRLDSFFSFLSGALQLALAVLVVVTLYEAGNEMIDAAVAGLLLAIYAEFFIFATLQVCWLWFRMQRRKRLEEERAITSSPLSVPLVRVTEGDVAADPADADERESDDAPNDLHDVGGSRKGPVVNPLGA